MTDMLMVQSHAAEAWLEVEQLHSATEPHRWIRTRKLCDVAPESAVAVDRRELEREAILNDAPRARCIVIWPDGLEYPVMYADRPSGPWPTE